MAGRVATRSSSSKLEVRHLEDSAALQHGTVAAADGVELAEVVVLHMVVVVVVAVLVGNFDLDIELFEDAEEVVLHMVEIIFELHAVEILLDIVEQLEEVVVVHYDLKHEKKYNFSPKIAFIIVSNIFLMQKWIVLLKMSKNAFKKEVFALQNGLFSEF